MGERLKRIKEKPLLDGRIPHPYREMVAWLKKISEQLDEVLQPAPAPPTPGVPPTAPRVIVPPTERVDLGISTINRLATEIAERITAVLVKLPNRLERIDIDTGTTTEISLRKKGLIKTPVALGFWVESIGGGFSYKIQRDGIGKDSRTAVADDKWDQEFDDILITGLGAGTAYLWYWWRE